MKCEVIQRIFIGITKSLQNIYVIDGLFMLKNSLWLFNKLFFVKVYAK
jgi:hypothetical protein